MTKNSNKQVQNDINDIELIEKLIRDIKCTENLFDAMVILNVYFNLTLRYFVKMGLLKGLEKSMYQDEFDRLVEAILVKYEKQ